MAWGEKYRIHEHCPRCGALIAYWGDSGMIQQTYEEKTTCERLPDIWPFTIDGCGSSSFTEAGRLLSDGTANAQALLGNG
jgi:hypothetical protein